MALKLSYQKQNYFQEIIQIFYFIEIILINKIQDIFFTDKASYNLFTIKKRVYEKIISDNPEQRVHSKLFPRDKIIRMAGNSIPVKLLEGFFYQMLKLDSLLGGNN